MCEVACGAEGSELLEDEGEGGGAVGFDVDEEGEGGGCVGGEDAVEGCGGSVLGGGDVREEGGVLVGEN